MIDPNVPENLHPNDVFMASLNLYDTIVLFSLTQKKVDEYEFHMTKSGGFWPLLLTRIYMEYEISHDDVIRATNIVYEEIYHDFQSDRADERFLERRSPNDLAILFTNKLLDRFTKDRNTQKLVHEVEKEYVESLRRLERKGMIVDNLEVGGLITLTKFLTEPQNELTDKGIKMVTKMSNIVDGQKSLRAEKLRQIKSLMGTFLDEMMMNISIRETG